MNVDSFRKSRGLSQTKFGRALGLGPKSKGYVSRLENGRQPWTLQLALKAEQVSGGELKAAELCPEAAELLASQRNNAAT